MALRIANCLSAASFCNLAIENRQVAEQPAPGIFVSFVARQKKAPRQRQQKRLRKQP
jgi:hypothetical protein